MFQNEFKNSSRIPEAKLCSRIFHEQYKNITGSYKILELFLKDVLEQFKNNHVLKTLNSSTGHELEIDFQELFLTLRSPLRKLGQRSHSYMYHDNSHILFLFCSAICPNFWDKFTVSIFSLLMGH